MDIAFHYLYRDAANYKKFGYVIFVNTDNINLSEFENLVKSKLTFGEWFYANEWRTPEFYFQTPLTLPSTRLGMSLKV